MIILGIDPGIAIVGYGVIKKDNSGISVVDFGVIETSKEESIATRLALVYEGINALIKKYNPQEIALEELFYFKNQKTIIPVCQARGVIVLSAVQKTGKLFEYTPLQIKQALTGNGRAEKKQVQFMVKSILGLEKIPKPDDAADALAVAITHAQTNIKLSNNQI